MYKEQALMLVSYGGEKNEKEDKEKSKEENN